MFANFVIGAPEIAIIMVAVIALAFGISILSRKKRAWKAPERTGPAIRVQAIAPGAMPLSSNAKWQGDELEVTAARGETVNLFDVPLADVDQCVLLYRFQVKGEALKQPAFAEMWCHVNGAGKFFSRGLDRKITTSAEWRTLEIPFYLGRGQEANLVNLNFVFEGPGVVRMKDIEVQSAPVGES